MKSSARHGTQGKPAASQIGSTSRGLILVPASLVAKWNTGRSSVSQQQMLANADVLEAGRGWVAGDKVFPDNKASEGFQ